MILLGVSPHILCWKIKCWNFVYEPRAGGRGERTQHSPIPLPEDIDWHDCLSDLCLCASVHIRQWRSSSSYFRGRERAEMTHEPCSYALKVPKFYMTQETTPNVMMFLLKLIERETISPLLHPKQWTAVSVKGADSVVLIFSIGRIEYTRDWVQRLLGNDEASSCVSFSVKPSQYNRLMELLQGLSSGVHWYRLVFNGCCAGFWVRLADFLVRAVKCHYINHLIKDLSPYNNQRNQK